MSRTWKTRPLMVRALDPHDGDVPLIEHHDHEVGECNLGPKQFKDLDVHAQCSYDFGWVGKGVCGCRMCTDHYERRTDRRRKRHTAKRQLQNMVKSQEFYAY